MLQRIFIWTFCALLFISAATYVAWATALDPKTNPASFEDSPLEIGISPLSEAVTLAQYRNQQNETVTLLVTDYADGIATGIDLADFGVARYNDPFEVLAAVEPAALQATAGFAPQQVKVPIHRLLPTGPSGTRHIGIGTNFPEHAEEAASDFVFNFPKFGKATPARASVAAIPSGLLDYEVELCVRFDRTIASLEDFDAAVKGFFLCADFTDRVTLLQLADFDNLDSGYGFSDAKSGEGYFPTGPFLVVPGDWRTFIARERMTTDLNGEPRQDARGGEMTLDYRQLAGKALSDMSEARFLYKGEFHKLSPSASIEPDMALMSGTSEGVIFTAPGPHDYIEMVIAYLFAGGPLSGKSIADIGIPVFVENEAHSGHFLKAGDVVTYRSSRLGDIVVEVVAAPVD